MGESSVRNATNMGAMPAQAFMEELERCAGSLEGGLALVRRWVRFCPYPEWVLLELPEGKWAALWSQGYGTEYTDMIAAGDYSLLSIVADTLDEAARHMAASLMYPADSHADKIALQRSSVVDQNTIG